VIRFRVNGEERALDASGCAHLGELIERGSRDGRASVVTRVRVNGCEIPEQGLSQLEALPLEGVELVEIETRLPRDVAFDSLESSGSYAAAIVASLRQTADHLRAGRIEAANRLYAETTDALGVLLFAVSAAARFLEHEGETIAGLEAELQPWLETLVAAQKERDWLRVADYLEYEVAERVEQRRQAIEQLRRSPTALAAREESDVRH
jgi:hypothetical protein